MRKFGLLKQFKMKRSWVWQYFDQDANGDAVCRACKKKFRTSSSTSGLIRHADKAHGVHKTTQPVKEADPTNHSDISYSDSEDIKNVNLIEVDLQPFGIIEEVNFKDYFQNPEYQPPVKRVRKSHHEQLEEVSIRIRIMMDAWRSIMTILRLATLHNIDTRPTSTCLHYYMYFKLGLLFFQSFDSSKKSNSSFFLLVIEMNTLILVWS